MNDGSSSFFLLMMLVCVMLALTNLTNLLARHAHKEEETKMGGKCESDNIKIWHILVIAFVVIAVLGAYEAYQDYHRKNWKGNLVVREVREFEVRQIVNNPNTGAVMVRLAKPGSKERKPDGYPYRGLPPLWADFTKPCSTIEFLPVGTLVKATFVARRYQDRFPTGYYETIENPDSLCP